MTPKKPEQPVTVTVRPDGSYYVERARGPQTGQTQIQPAWPKAQAQTQAVPRAQPRVSPVAVAVTTSLRDLAGIVAVARTVAPALGKYGVVAAIGLGVLNAWAEAPPRPPAGQFRRIRLRRIPR